MILSGLLFFLSYLCIGVKKKKIRKKEKKKKKPWLASYYSSRTPYSHSEIPLPAINTLLLLPCTEPPKLNRLSLSLTHTQRIRIENPWSKSAMGDSRAFSDPVSTLHRRSNAGIIKRIRLENFMCHDNLQIELGEWVNFITGQNGSKRLPLSICSCQLRTECEMHQFNKLFFVIYFIRF